MVQRFWQVMLLLVLLVACTQPQTTPTTQETDNMQESMDDMDSMQDDMEEMGSDTESMDESMDDMGEMMDDMDSPDVTLSLQGENFKFLRDGVENPELNVNLGDRVRVEFSSNQGFHDWVVDEFDAATSRVRPEDGVTVVDFTADKAGTFDYYCSVGSHRANGMEGSLVVA